MRISKVREYQNLRMSEKSSTFVVATKNGK